MWCGLYDGLYIEFSSRCFHCFLSIFVVVNIYIFFFTEERSCTCLCKQTLLEIYSMLWVANLGGSWMFPLIPFPPPFFSFLYCFLFLRRVDFFGRVLKMVKGKFQLLITNWSKIGSIELLGLQSYCQVNSFGNEETILQST